MTRTVPVPRGRDVVVAAVLAVVAVVATVVVAVVQGTAPPGPLALVAVAVAALAWGWHRVAPSVSALAVVAVVAGYMVAGGPYGPIQLVAALSCFALAHRAPSRRAATVGAVAAVVLAGALWTRLDTSQLVSTAAVLVGWTGVFVVVPALAGALVRARAQATARHRAEWLARGADEERLRVAREVHDIAGHGFSVVAMQAGVALTVFDEDAHQARVCLEAVRTTSEHALRELHGSLDALHVEAPTARDVPALVDRVRAGGLAVELVESGAPGRLSGEVSTTVYRLVQEALTNVIRHAAAGSATVTVTHSPAEVSVRVTDRGTGAAPGARHDGGRGLATLRARVEGLGGTFAAGTRSPAGFEIRASLPSGGAS